MACGASSLSSSVAEPFLLWTRIFRRSFLTLHDLESPYPPKRFLFLFRRYTVGFRVLCAPFLRAATRTCRFPYHPRRVTGRVATKEDSDEREWSRSLDCREHRPRRTLGLVNPQDTLRAKSLEDASPDGGRVALRPVPPSYDRLDARAPRRSQRAPGQTRIPTRRLRRVLVGFPRGTIPCRMFWVPDRPRGLAPSRSRA